MDPHNVGVSRNFQLGNVSMMITGLDPAGGCTVRVSCMSATAVAKASAIDHQEAPRIDKKHNPVNDVRK